MSYQDELVCLSPEISFESSASVVAANLAPLREQKVANEESAEYTLITQRLKAIQEILWVDPNVERLEQLIRSVIQTCLNFGSQWYNPDSSAYSLGQLHNLIKEVRPELNSLIEEAMEAVWHRAKKTYIKRGVATTIARHFHPENAPQAISNQVAGLISFLSENEVVLLTNSYLIDHHASRIQELQWLTQVGSEADRAEIGAYLKGFFNRHPFGQLNPMNAGDCIRVHTLVNNLEKPDPALVAELLDTVKTELRATLASHLPHSEWRQPEKLGALIGHMDDYFTDNSDRFVPETWSHFMKTAGVQPKEFIGKDVEQFNSIIFRHELALKSLHSLLMDYGQFDEAIAILPQFLSSHNALVTVHNSQGDALVLNNPALFDRLLAEYFKAYGRKKYDTRDRFQRDFDVHFPYQCAVGIAIHSGRLSDLKLTDEIRAAVRYSSHDLCDKIETFLTMPVASEWYSFGRKLLYKLIEEYKQPMSSIDGEDKMTEALRALLYWETHD